MTSALPACASAAAPTPRTHATATTCSGALPLDILRPPLVSLFLPRRICWLLFRRGRGQHLHGITDTDQPARHHLRHHAQAARRRLSEFALVLLEPSTPGARFDDFRARALANPDARADRKRIHVQ